MELILGVYLMIAGVLYAGQKHGVISDNTTVSTYKFEAEAAERSGDVLLAGFLNGRLAQWSCAENEK